MGRVHGKFGSAVGTARRRPVADRPRRRRLPQLGLVAAGVAVVLVAAGCGSNGGSGGKGQTASAQESTVTITLTSQGCVPKPDKVEAGDIQFNVSNSDAGAVSEAELRTSDMSHLLAEQENLTPGLSGGFELTVVPGHYIINCPGASQPHASFVVTGVPRTVSHVDQASLSKAVGAYATYVNANVSSLVTSTQTMCDAISAGDLQTAQRDYPKARIYYERIEPVASVWGTLDTAIDGRINNPVTNPKKLQGFHRIEELMWADDTLKGAPAFCSQLVAHEKQLRTLVGKATYNPVTMASGATDLINEAATSKITGEEERYSNTDFIVFQANVDGAMKVVDLLRSYLHKSDPSLLALIDQRYHAVESAIAKYRATPGYDDTGYVEYSTVLDSARRKLSGVVQAFAEALSKIPGQVG